MGPAYGLPLSVAWAKHVCVPAPTFEVSGEVQLHKNHLYGPKERWQ
jgi:hypothetical protein